MNWQNKFLVCFLGAGIFFYGLAAPSAQAADALAFGGTNAYVTFGQASPLGLSAFTLETWLRRDGSGQPSFTGNGGLSAIPLVTKGRGEDDGSNVDMNYFLGIDAARGVLVADFEDKQTGANHPIFGVTVLRFNTWYHAAVTYNGSKWQLYLNGVLEAELTVGEPARNDSIQPAALGAALNSTGLPEGFFAGALDEVRIWNYARPPQQIKDGVRQQITSATGLMARWGLNEGSGININDSTGRNINGTLRGTDGIWVNGVKFSNNLPPAIPVLLSPANNSLNVTTAPTLSAAVFDPDSSNLIVTYYGKIAGTSGSDFSLIVLPDTQYYTSNLFGGTPAMFAAQTQWIVHQRAARNIAYVAHLGDCVENADSLTEWQNADAAMRLLENPVTTGLADGIPFGVAVGNHDQTPFGNPDGNSTRLFNQYFGTSRFYKRDYLGGRRGNNLDNQYQLFSAGGMDFIVLYLEYDETPDAAILNWANSLLKTYNNRRAIMVSHSLLDANALFSGQGQAIYDALKNNANLFLMLCGHVSTESRRQDIFNGQTVHTLLANFQDLRSGGDGWLRLLEFSPTNNQIRVKTFSPTLNIYDQSAPSQFTLAYNMQDSGFTTIKTNPNVAAGNTATTNWARLRPNTEYEWYVSVSDGFSTVSSAHWKFKTGAN